MDMNLIYKKLINICKDYVKVLNMKKIIFKNYTNQFFNKNKIKIY